MTGFEAPHACVKTKSASSILCGVFAATLQVLVPTDWLAFFCFQVKALQLGWKLTGGLWSLRLRPLVAVVSQWHSTLIRSWLNHPLLDALNWGQVHIDARICHQSFHLQVQRWISLYIPRLARGKIPGRHAAIDPMKLD